MELTDLTKLLYIYQSLSLRKISIYLNLRIYTHCNAMEKILAIIRKVVY